jgi:enoyl-[acyl-carrier protein] reductase II
MGQAQGLETAFTRSYGLRHPFACAGLAFAGTTPELAIAVANAGGIGAIGMGKLPPPAGAAMIGAFRQASKGPLNVNFITIFTEDAHIAMCVEEEPDVVSFHWGHPKKAWIDQLQAAGIRVWEQVGSAEMAQTALGDGIDLLIVQGTEAGGHNYGTLPLFVQLPAIRDAVGTDVLLLAAGGIMDGRGVAAALALGADGVWVGTRLIASQEANIAQAYKDKLVDAVGEDTVRSSLFGGDTPDFNPMRVLKTRIVKEWDGKPDAPSSPEGQPIVGEMDVLGMTMPIQKFSNLLPMGGATGDVEEMPLLAGQGVGQVKDLPPAGHIVEAMMAQADALLARMGRA